MGLKKILLISVAMASFSFGHVALAKATPDEVSGVIIEDGKEIFLPKYFDRFSPRTAEDMLRKIPGFTLRGRGGGGGGGKRGLGQGGVNVIINGARVSGKQTDPISVLGRTPVDNVIRIEIVDAASLGIPGLTGQVANFIIESKEMSGNWEWNPRFRTGLKTDVFNGKVSVSGEKENLSYTFALDNTRAFKGGGTGDEFVYNSAGDLLEVRSEDRQFYGERPKLSANLTWNRDNGHIANLNGQYQIFDFRRTELSKRDVLDTSAEDSVRNFVGEEEEWNTEVSGDYSFPVGPGTLKLIGVQYFEHSPFTSTVLTESANGDVDGFRFKQEADEGETIFRSEYSWAPSDKRSFEVALEGAFNFLEVDDELFELQNDTFQAIDGTTSSSRVEEIRFETTIAHTRSLTPKLDLQTSIGVEYSEIEQRSNFLITDQDPVTGDDIFVPATTQQKRRFTRPKGFASLAYKFNDSTDLRFKIERDIGQLQFFDFIGSVNLDNDIDSAGNPELVPPQSWDVNLDFEKRFANDSQIALGFFARDIEDIVDTIPLELPGADLSDPNRERGEGPGNIESALLYGVEFSGTIELTDFGDEGGQLEFRAEFQESEVEDPLTGEKRELSRSDRLSLNLDYRKDIPNTDYAYGFFSGHRRNNPSVGLRQISVEQQEDPFVGIFVEDKDFFGMNFRVNVANLTNTAEKLDRTVFDDFRDVPGVDFTREVREDRFDHILRLRLSGNF